MAAAAPCRKLHKEPDMPDNVEQFPIWRITEAGRENTTDVVAREFRLTITLNNQEVATRLCSPRNLDYLAVGFLASEGLIEGKDDINKIDVDSSGGTVRVTTKRDIQPARGQTKVDSDIEISPSQVFALIDDFAQRSEVFKATGGVHSAALGNAKNILVFNEDIGRHNAIDKVFGECLLNNIPTAGRLLITSGRVSSEIVLKVAGRNVPLLISRAAPTDLGVRLARDLGVTLIGFARDRKMNLYANEWRIKR
jgi:FdhD protein